MTFVNPAFFSTVYKNPNISVVKGLLINIHEKPLTMNAYQDLRNLMANKLMNEGTRRAVRTRLEMILDEELKHFTRWQNIIKSKLNSTRAAQVERRFNKEIQALKIVIYKLTPFGDRVDDEPSIVVKKKPK